MVSVEKINDYIRRNGLKNADFESLCGLPNGSVYKWNQGKSKPGLTALTRIADHTKIPLTKWLDDKDKRCTGG